MGENLWSTTTCLGWECFHRIVWSFGSLLRLEKQTERQDRLDVARVQIAVTSWEFVDEVQMIKVNEEAFTVRVVEERFGDIDFGLRRQAASQAYSEEEEEGVNQERRTTVVVDEQRSIFDVDGGSGEIDLVGKDQGLKTTNCRSGSEEREIVIPVTVSVNTKEVVGDGDRLLNSGGEGDNTNERQTLLLTQVQRKGEEETKMTEGVDELSAVETLGEYYTRLRNQCEGNKNICLAKLDNGPDMVDLGLERPIIENLMDHGVINNKNKNKIIYEDHEVIGWEKGLLRGSGSKWANSSAGPEKENNWVVKLKTKEVSKLAFEHQKDTCGNTTMTVRNKEALTKTKKQSSVGGGGRVGTVGWLGGSRKSERFLKAVQGRAKGQLLLWRIIWEKETTRSILKKIIAHIDWK
ncbi:hypothetical protein TSUD_53960 [Trifolium subterraneum]|uniref:DUF4283 domain-containing protein n=1 Tax=Trifolium subterraneum TaxID=3900 RepID=A0A2Z6MG99_TRISU|nr:hypothetical protein TSUD_53960 [Trifolium subterraneum]